MQRIVRAALAWCMLSVAACSESPTAVQGDDDLAPAFAAVAETINLFEPVDLLVFVPCAASGAGEEVVLSGFLHILLHVTLDGRGGVHVKQHFQPQGVSGFGVTTGDKYQATGVTQDRFNLTVGVQQTFVNNFRIIGQGRGNNFSVHQNFHITVNANGTVTSFVDNFRASCK